MPYVFFISSTRDFSLVLSSRFYAGLLPIVGRPMMKEMSSTSIEKISSNHTNPLWRTANNCFTQLFASFPLPKWGILSKFKMPVLARSNAHCFGCKIGSPKGLVPMLSRYTCFTNSGNFPASSTSWFEYRSLSTHPSRLGVTCTPSGMHDSTIVESRCRCDHRIMGFFPFLLGISLEVPTSICLFWASDSGWPVISSTRPSCCCANPTLCNCIGMTTSVCAVVAPFPLWDPSTLASLCGLPASSTWWTCEFSCRLMSMEAIVGDHIYSSTGVWIVGSSCGEVILSTSMNSPLCVAFGLALLVP
jgi:hypothetical protein